MKIYSIALFLLIFNVCLGLVQAAPLFDSQLNNSAPIYIGGTHQSPDISAFNSSTAPNLPTDQNDVFTSLLAIPTLIWN